MTNLTYEDFVQDLKKEIAYHSNGNSDYRKVTSILSLKIAIETRDVNVFLDKRKTVTLVNKHLSLSDKYRKQDVAKMLNMVARSLYVKKNLQNEELEKHINHVLGKKLTTV